MASGEWRVTSEEPTAVCDRIVTIRANFDCQAVLFRLPPSTLYVPLYISTRHSPLVAGHFPLHRLFQTSQEFRKNPGPFRRRNEYQLL